MTPSSSDIRVLTVEDDPVFSLQLQLMLEKGGGGSILVERAASLAEASARLVRPGIDAVLLDLNLPDSEGLGTVERICAVCPDTPVVVITASDDDELAMAALGLGAQEYLVKGEERARHVVRTVRYTVERHRHEKSLAASEQRFRDFAEVAADWFWELDSELRFSWLSDRASSILGFDATQLLGRTRADVAAEEEAEKIREHMATMERREQYRDFVYRLERFGTRRYLRVSGKPIYAADGTFIGYRGVGSDVTAEIEAEQFALSMLSVLMDSLSAFPSGVMVFDAADRLIVCNDMVGNLLPCSIDRLVPGTPFMDLLQGAVDSGCLTVAEEDKEAWLERWRTDKSRHAGTVAESTKAGIMMYFHQYPTATGGMLRMVRFERGAHLNQE